MYVCVADFNIRKTLAFRARYAVKCSLISAPVTRSTLQSLANFNYQEIKAVCQNGMFVIEYMLPLELSSHILEIPNDA